LCAELKVCTMHNYRRRHCQNPRKVFQTFDTLITVPTFDGSIYTMPHVFKSIPLITADR
jgi:hypothetical protein